MFYSDKMTASEYALIVFSIKITVFWCMFIIFTSINDLIQGIASITESSFFIVFRLNEFTLCSIDSKVDLRSAIFKMLAED